MKLKLIISMSATRMNGVNKVNEMAQLVYYDFTIKYFKYNLVRKLTST